MFLKNPARIELAAPIPPLSQKTMQEAKEHRPCARHSVTGQGLRAARGGRIPGKITRQAGKRCFSSSAEQSSVK